MTVQKERVQRQNTPTKQVSIRLLLFGKPAWELDGFENGEVTKLLADEIKREGNHLKLRLESVANTVTRLVENGWTGEGGLYDITLRKDITLKKATEELKRLGLDGNLAQLEEEEIQFEDGSFTVSDVPMGAMSVTTRHGVTGIDKSFEVVRQDIESAFDKIDSLKDSKKKVQRELRKKTRELNELRLKIERASWLTQEQRKELLDDILYIRRLQNTVDYLSSNSNRRVGERYSSRGE